MIILTEVGKQKLPTSCFQLLTFKNIEARISIQGIKKKFLLFKN